MREPRAGNPRYKAIQPRAAVLQNAEAWTGPQADRLTSYLDPLFQNPQFHAGIYEVHTRRHYLVIGTQTVQHFIIVGFG